MKKPKEKKSKMRAIDLIEEHEVPVRKWCIEQAINHTPVGDSFLLRAQEIYDWVIRGEK